MKNVHNNSENNMAEYNGWRNYETWVVNLELVDGVTLDVLGMDYHKDEDDFHEASQEVADLLEAYIYDSIQSQGNPGAISLAERFLAQVDWLEIAEHLVADH